MRPSTVDGRPEPTDELLGVIRSPSAPPLVLLSGPAGVGRSTLLARLQSALGRAGTRVVPMRFTRDAAVVPAGLALHLGRGADPVDPVRNPVHPGRRWSPIGPVDGAHDDPGIARWAAAAAAAPMMVTGHVALLVDDAQWIDRDTLAVLEALVHRIAGSTVSCVVATRTPVPAEMAGPGTAALRRLHAGGLVHPHRLRPFGAAQIAREVAAVTHGTATPDLVARLRGLSRGVPAAVHDVVAAMTAAGAVQVVDRHAYLVPAVCAEPPRPDHDLTVPVRALGPAVWAVAKAAAVLHPLGDALPALVAAALELSEPDALARLDRLRTEGVLHRGRHGASWRFTVPFVGHALRDSLGPYERRHLAATAVDALWSGAATCADPDYLTDRVADAGRTVDPARARAELLGRARAAMRDRPERSVRWLRAAGELAEDRPQRVMTLLMHAEACFMQGDHEQSLHSAQTVLRTFPDLIPPGYEPDVLAILVCSMHAVGDVAGLEEIAAGRRLGHGSAAARTVSRGIALSMLDRWDESARLLAGTRAVWSVDRRATSLGELFETVSGAWGGHPERLQRLLADCGRWPAETRDSVPYTVELSVIVTVLLGLGELRRAEELLAAKRTPAWRLERPPRALLDTMQGRLPDNGLDAARRCVAGATPRGHDKAWALLHQTMADTLIVCGHLHRARETLATARAANPVLAHMLEIPAVDIDRILGDDDGARARAVAALRRAEGHGLLVGTELLWARLIDMATKRGDTDSARLSLARLDVTAAALQTSRAEMYRLALRAVVERDRPAMHASLALCRERGVPAELPMVIVKLVEHGMGDPAMLREAYAVYGQFDMLLSRAWTRNLMVRFDVPIPGRSVTVAENERLLAVLVAEGLSNKQVAHALHASDKSVEGRLSRLFARTGYRSRIELAAAVQNGDYEPS